MRKIILFLFIFVISRTTLAHDWSMSVGMNNPPGSTLGLNFMYLWSNVAFEFGVGQLGSSTNSSNTTSVATGGDVNFKYLFGSTWFRPYVQVGTSVGVSVGSGASASTGSTFGGLGFFTLGQPIYAYFSYMVGASNGLQFGVGYRF